jgi:hypothetical protein
VVYGILEDQDGNIIIGTSKGFTVLKGGLSADGNGRYAKEGVEHFNQLTGYPIKDVSNNYAMMIDSRGTFGQERVINWCGLIIMRCAEIPGLHKCLYKVLG